MGKINKIKLSKITGVEFLKAFNKLTSLTQLSTVTAFRLSRFLKKLSDDLSAFNDQRSKLIEKYSEKDEKGNPKNDNGRVTLQKDKIKEFDQKLAELGEEEIDVDIIKVNAKELGEKSGLSAAEMLILEDFLDI